MKKLKYVKDYKKYLESVDFDEDLQKEEIDEEKEKDLKKSGKLAIKVPNLKRW